MRRYYLSTYQVNSCERLDPPRALRKPFVCGMGLYDDRLADLSEARRVASREPFARVRGVVRPPALETSGRPSMDVQSLLFSRSDGWTESKAKSWAKSHGYKHGKVHVTDQYIRIRQFSPKGSKVERTITFGHGIRAVVAREEGQNMASTKEARRPRRRRAREAAAPVATEAKRRRRRKTREAPVATEAKRRKRRKSSGETSSKRRAAAKKGWKRRKHGRAREAPVATEARRHRRRRTSEARRPVSGQVMEARRHRKRRSHRTREAWHGSKAEHRKAAKKGWRKRKHGGGSRSAKRSAASKKAWKTRRARARSKFIGPVTKRRRKGHMFEEARRPRRRRHRAREVSEVKETRRRRRRHTRELGMFEARSRRGKSGRGMYVAEMALAIGSGSFMYIVANGFDRWLATYNPETDPAKLPKHKFTSDGAGTLANTLNISSHPSWLRIGAGLGMAALPAVGSIFVEHPMLRSSLEGAAVGASVQFIQMIWSNVVVPLLAPKDTSNDGLKKSFIARLYPTEIAAAINMKAQTPPGPSALTGGTATGLSGAEAPAAGVGQPDVGPFALQGPSYYPSAVEALRAHAQAAGLNGGHESNRLETGIGYYPTVQELWRQASGGDTASGFRPSVQDILTRTTTAVQSLAPAVQAAMPAATPAQAEQVSVAALTQPNDIPSAIQQVFPTMPEEHRQEFGRRLHPHVHHHAHRMRGGGDMVPPPPPFEPGMPGASPPPGEMFGGLVEEARRRFPHMRHEHHMQIAGHILTEPQNIVGALRRAMPHESENVLKEHARHFHRHVKHVAEAVAPGAPPPEAALPAPAPAPIPVAAPVPEHGHVAGLGDTGLGYVMRGINSFGRPYSPLQSSQFAAHAYSQPWNLPGVTQRWMPGQTQQQYYDYGRRLHPYVQQQYGQQYGQQAGNLYSVVQQILPEVPTTQLQALISQLEAAPYNMIAILQQVLPNVPEYLLQYRAQKLHPYFVNARPAPPTLSGTGVDQPPPLPPPGPSGIPDVPGPNGKPAGESCGCGDNDLFLGFAGVGVDGESAKEEERLILG